MYYLEDEVNHTFPPTNIPITEIMIIEKENSEDVQEVWVRSGREWYVAGIYYMFMFRSSPCDEKPYTSIDIGNGWTPVSPGALLRQVSQPPTVI